LLHVLTDTRSINFNIVSKGLGSDRMSYYLNEAAGEMRDLLIPTIAPPKAKL
jgi:carnitine O-acetyltransferase